MYFNIWNLTVGLEHLQFLLGLGHSLKSPPRRRGWIDWTLVGVRGGYFFSDYLDFPIKSSSLWEMELECASQRIYELGSLLFLVSFHVCILSLFIKILWLHLWLYHILIWFLGILIFVEILMIEIWDVISLLNTLNDSFLCLVGACDRRRLTLEPLSVFSCKSFYDFLLDDSSCPLLYILWWSGKTKVPLKVQVFA